MTGERTLAAGGHSARLSVYGAAAVSIALIIVERYLKSIDLFAGYLTALMFWTGVSLGSLSLLFVYELSGGRWGEAAAHFLEQSVRALPLLVILAAPLYLGTSFMYPWGVPLSADPLSADPLSAESLSAEVNHLRELHPVWFSPAVSALRAAAYFGIWLWLARALVKRRRANILRQGLSGLGLVMLLATVTLASFDWIMSLTPKWHSMAFGLIVMISFSTIGMAFVSLRVLRELPETEGRIRWDLAKLLFVLVILDLYLAFSQYIVIWTGDIVGEIPWYVVRQFSGWRWLTLFLLIFEFFLPAILLLFSGWRLSTHKFACWLVLITQVLGMAWTVLPSLPVTFWSWIALSASMGVIGSLCMVSLKEPTSARVGGAAHGA